MHSLILTQALFELKRSETSNAIIITLGAVAQLARVPPWHGGSRGFESHQLHQLSEAHRVDIHMWIKQAIGLNTIELLLR